MPPEEDGGAAGSACSLSPFGERVGVRGLPNYRETRPPSPHPSPPRGEGADRARRADVVGSHLFSLHGNIRLGRHRLPDAMSLRMKAANSSGVLPTVCMACLTSSACVSGCCSALTISLLSFLTMAGGVFAGARMPCQATASKPGKPLSATVGTSGATAERLRLVTASARRLPD